jgi:hypothetical protein
MPASAWPRHQPRGPVVWPAGAPGALPTSRAMLGVASALVNPTIAAGLIAAGISVVSFGFNAWTTSKTLWAARAANLRDRQATVYQQVLAYTAHQTESRRKRTRKVRYEPQVEARLQDLLDGYTAPNWFDLQGNVLAFCPDSVVRAFIAAKEADDAVWFAEAARSEAVILNQAHPSQADPNGVVALQAEFQERIAKAERADAELIDIIRSKMLGSHPADGNHSLIGKAVYQARSRQSLR